MMRFGQIDAEIAKCEEYLKAAGADGSEIEFYLTQYLVVRIVAEYEARIKTLIQRRCARGNDDHVKAFVSSSARIVTRDFNIGDIKGYLGRFGEDYAKAFRDVIDADLIQLWDNMYTARQKVAHLTGFQMTLRELKENYQKTRTVIDSVAMALTLKPRELKDLQ
jgi:hypothetical protein